MGTSTNAGAARAARRIRRRPRHRHAATPTGPTRCWRPPAARASTSSSTRSPASVANENLRAAAILGRIVNVGRLGGLHGRVRLRPARPASASTISASPSARARSRRCARSSAACAPTSGRRVEAGKLSLPIDATFPLDEAADGAGAHAGQRAFRQDRADRRLMRSDTAGRLGCPTVMVGEGRPSTSFRASKPSPGRPAGRA